MCPRSTLALPRIQHPFDSGGYLDHNSDKKSAILGLLLRKEERVIGNGEQETVSVASSLDDGKPSESTNAISKLEHRPSPIAKRACSSGVEIIREFTSLARWVFASLQTMENRPEAKQLTQTNEDPLKLHT
jgi:hypothetical protein